MPSVLTTYSGVDPDVQRNLRFGIRKGRWGLRKEPVDWKAATTFGWHVIGAQAKGLRRGPRCQPEEWVTATIDVYIFRVLSPLVLESGYFWPDEVRQSELMYPYRFDIELVAHAPGVSTAYNAPIPADISEGIRRAASRAESIAIVGDKDWTAFVDEITRRQ
ncbi:hypothetical protein GOAMI_61_00020 [Gordonia amicalis NBRC 100051 = JCM 11271]|nr:hypothetical protein GOAMI_61_00020 [Gordonia amicalis NBRC 100051 = JCM 11271]